MLFLSFRKVFISSRFHFLRQLCCGLLWGNNWTHGMHELRHWEILGHRRVNNLREMCYRPVSAHVWSDCMYELLSRYPICNNRGDKLKQLQHLHHRSVLCKWGWYLHELCGGQGCRFKWAIILLELLSGFLRIFKWAVCLQQLSSWVLLSYQCDDLLDLFCGYIPRHNWPVRLPELRRREELCCHRCE